jgi:hypothetical protein
LKKAYCEPNKNLSGGVVEPVKVTFQSVKIAAPRLGRYRSDGVPPNTKTYVFPVRAKYFCDYSDPSGTYSPSDLRIAGDYVVFRDEFGTWTFRGSRHVATRVRA